MMRRIEKLFRLCCWSVNQLKKLVIESLFRIVRCLCKQVLCTSSLDKRYIFILDIFAEYDVGLSPTKRGCSVRVLLFVQVPVIEIVGPFTDDPPLDSLDILAKTCGGIHRCISHV